MFEAVAAATSGIKIEGMDIHLNFIGPAVPIEVYTRAGTYQGYSRRPSAWSLYFSGTVHGKGPGISTLVGPITGEPIVIGAGQTQSFYVATVGNENISILCDDTSAVQEGHVYASNMDLSIFSGVITGDKLFSSKIGNGCAWDGILYYTEHGEARDAGTTTTESSAKNVTTDVRVLMALLLLTICIV